MYKLKMKLLKLFFQQLKEPIQFLNKSEDLYNDFLYEFQTINQKKLALCINGWFSQKSSQINTIGIVFQSNDNKQYFVNIRKTVKENLTGNLVYHFKLSGFPIELFKNKQWNICFLIESNRKKYLIKTTFSISCKDGALNLINVSEDNKYLKLPILKTLHNKKIIEYDNLSSVNSSSDDIIQKIYKPYERRGKLNIRYPKINLFEPVKNAKLILLKDARYPMFFDDKAHIIKESGILNMEIPRNLTCFKNFEPFLNSTIKYLSLIDNYNKQNSFYPTKEIKGNSFSLLGATPNEYYHWTAEVLPRLSFIEKSGIPVDNIIAPPVKYNFQKKMLEFCNTKGINIEYVEEDTLINIENAYFATPYYYKDKVCKWVYDFWQNAINTNIDKVMASDYYDKYDKIYISRKYQKARRISNDEEVTEYLESNGFKTICPEKFSLIDQIAMFYNVNTVVAPQGAGFSNLLFTSQQPKVIEIHNPNDATGCFFAISCVAGCEDNYIVGKDENGDTFVDVDMLSKVI